jgi:hypothetical protein
MDVSRRGGFGKNEKKRKVADSEIRNTRIEIVYQRLIRQVGMV